jgi:pantothenate kinase
MAKFDGMSKDELVAYIAESKDDNIFAWTQLIRLGMSLEELHELTKVTDLFLQSLERIVEMEKRLQENRDEETLRAAKVMGFADAVIARLNEREQPIVFLLWGSPARAKKALITNPRHLILEAPHPSPLSAHRGFFGCKHFSKCNAFLRQNGMREIDWQIHEKP